MRWFFQKTTSHIKQMVSSSKLYQIRNKISEHYTSDFNLIVDFFREHQQTTAVRFQIIEHYESYNKTIEMDYDADDTIFVGYYYKSNIPDFSKTYRSEYGNRTDFKQDIIEVFGNNCYYSTSGYCFIKN